MRAKNILCFILIFINSVIYTKVYGFDGSPLIVSENGHYLTTPDGKPIFLFSDTQWVINKFTDEQVIKILNDRKSKGFNAIQVFAARSWDKNWWVGDQSWAQTDANENRPFVDNNPEKLNKAYWDRWGWIIDEAKKRDMYFIMLIGGPLREDAGVKVKTLEQAYEYAWQIGNLFCKKSNLIISVSEDNPPSRSALGIPGFDAAAEGITDGFSNIRNYDGKADYTRSLITYHTWASSSEWFHSKPWLDMNGVQGSRNENDLINDKIVYKRINMDYNRTDPVKPVLFLEGSYENEPNKSGKLQPTTPRNVRMQFLYAFFGGSAGFSYGHWDNWRQYKSIDYLNSPGANQIPNIASFIRKYEWWKLSPASDIIVDGVGTGEQMKVAIK
jgi:hypothetical protein